MAKFTFTRDEAVWQRWAYEVEAETLEEAQEKFDKGDWEEGSAYLVDGSVCETNLDNQIHEIRDETGKVLWTGYEDNWSPESEEPVAA